MMPLKMDEPRVERDVGEDAEDTNLKIIDEVKTAFEKLFKIPTYKHGSLFDLYD